MAEELIKTKYHFELDGREIFAAYDYFSTEGQATEYYLEHIEEFKREYGERVTDFVLVREKIYSKSEVVRKMHWVKYIVGCDSDIGELFVSTLEGHTVKLYLTPYKSDVIKNNYFYSREDAEHRLEFYKEKLKPYYKEEVLNAMKIIEITEEDCK